MQRNVGGILGGILALCLAAGLAAGWRAQAGGGAAAAPAAQNAFTPQAIHFGPAPPFIPPGAQLAVLEGDPMAHRGDYTVRLKMPAGYRIPPHWHQRRENVTVISGRLKLGMGNHFVAGSMKTYPPGSFVYLDPAMHHYAMAASATVVQIHGASPVQFNYVNPKDDPSHRP